jgi:lipopolysaccharide export system ATP-binding protein
MSEPLVTSRLEARHLKKAYGSRKVVHDVSVQVDKGEVVGLLGPNGAGKTTSFYMIVGLVRGDGGQILIDGQDVTRLPIHKRSRMGLSYLPQEASIFRKLSVAENVRAILELQTDAQGAPLKSAALEKRLDELLNDLRVGHLRDSPAMSLSGGERRRVEIARALATNPRFILLDEPFAGIDPVAVSGLQGLVRALAATGIAVLVTDHAVRETLAICDRATVVDGGTVQVEGTPSAVANDPRARARYLGPDFVLGVPLPSARKTDTMED